MLPLKLFFIFLLQFFFLFNHHAITKCPFLYNITTALLCRNGGNLNTTAIYCPVSDTYSPKMKLEFMGAAVLEILDIAVHKE